MSKKEDDLSIDLSGIGRKMGSFFRSDSREKHEEKHARHEPHAAEHHAASHQKKSDDEISIDFKAAGRFIVKHKTVFLLLIPIFIAIFFRAYPIYLPITDDWAKNSVDRYYKAQILEQVNRQYPNLPSENKEAIANENLQKFVSEQKQLYDQQVAQVSQNFRSQFQDENGQTYILDIDPWHWFRYMRNIVDHGYPGDYVREDGVMMDNHMVAPIGNKVGKELHPYFGAYLHMFLRMFNSNISVARSFFMLPLVLSVLMVIPAFLIGRKIGGDLGGLFTSIIIVTNPSLLTRTTAGVPDTDIYTILFPLIIVWLFFEALDSNKIKNATIYSLVAGLFVAIFSATWYGWWYIFDFIAVVTALYLIYLFAVQKVNLKEIFDIKKGKNGLVVLSLILFILASFVFVTLFTSFSNFSSVYRQPISFIKIKQSANPTLWPNVFTTVAELNEASLSQIIQSIGGKLLFAISLLGIVLTLTTGKEGRSNPKYAILLVIWFSATIYASTKGIRFVNLLVPAFAMGIGAAVGISFRYLSKWITEELNVNKILCSVILVLLALMILLAPIKTAEATARNQVPLINDGWYNALTKIKTNSTENAIVNSWWDFGHWFKVVADRAVTFDGASQNRPQAHWIGHVLLTDNEDEAIGILRMLDCKANMAFDVLNNETGNMHKSIDLLYDIIVLDKENARKVLEKNIPADKVDSVLKYTHCSPPEDYFITSEDMVGKAGVWAHFGSWDFEKAKIWAELRKKPAEEAVAIMEKEFNYSEEKAQNLYYEVQGITDEKQANEWISSWPGYAGIVGCSAVDNLTIQCVFQLGNQVVPFQINMNSMEASIETTTGKVYPSSLVYMDREGRFAEKKYADKTLPYSLAIVSEDGGYKGILMSPPLAASMFTRLFYFNGAGLKHFNKFDHEVDISGQNIIVWKINWEGKN